MYLEEICELDERWPNDSMDTLNFFHGILTIKYLKEFILKEGYDNYKKLIKVFPQCDLEN